MTDAAAATRALRRTLNAVGVLLIVGAVVTFTQTGFFASPLSIVLGWTGIAAFSAALVVCAVGIGRAGSLVQRRPLAVTVAIIAAVWPLVERVLTLALPYSEESRDFYGIWGYISLAVRLGALVILVVQIARAGVLQGQVRWLPLWGLAVVVAPQLIAQVLIVALGANLGTSENDAILLVFGLGQLLSFAVPVALGVIALIIANRPDPAPAVGPVQIYPPAG